MDRMQPLQRINLSELSQSIKERYQNFIVNQATLFAIHPRSPFHANEQPDQRPVRFELTTAEEIMRWSWWPGKGVSFFSLTRPAGSPAEYEQQMRAMLALIQERTHLPLYDLRKQL